MLKIIYIFYAEVLALIILASVSDFRTYKISNSINYFFILLGTLSNLVFYGLRGLRSSVGGIIVPLIVLLLLYALRMLGAGDIKLFCAIGAIAGVKFVLYSIAFSVISGGIIALAIMLFRKNAVKRFAYFTTYLKSCLLSAAILPYSDFEDKSDGGKMHFSYAVACGTSILIAAKLTGWKLLNMN